jgi:hypothetical protein
VVGEMMRIQGAARSGIRHKAQPRPSVGGTDLEGPFEPSPFMVCKSEGQKFMVVDRNYTMPF